MPGSAVDTISVAELTRRLRRAVEPVSAECWVEGEVSALKRASSGHAYFSLKDEAEPAVVECVMYKFYAQRARRHLLDGARLQVLGKATVYAPRGRLQLVVEAARPAGRGALLEALERLKEKLKSEGLLDASRKRPLPGSPRVIGLVTSASGAAFHDICTVAFRRGGAHLVLSPAAVQGDAAPQSLMRALDLIEALPDLDVIILGRGGGSAEDLMAFNQEQLVRRVARCRVPVVSAVGHEIDLSLTDLVADVRAATPSQAAELVVPDGVARVEALKRTERQLKRVISTRLLHQRAQVSRLRVSMSDPRFLIAERQQYADDLRLRLERTARRRTRVQRQRLERLRDRLLRRHPRVVVANALAELSPLAGRLSAAMRRRVQLARGSLDERASHLSGLSPLGVLRRGYAIVKKKNGQIVLSPQQVAEGEAVSVRVHRGQFGVRVLANEREDR